MKISVLNRSKDLPRLSPFIFSAALMVAACQASAQDYDDDEDGDGTWEVILGAGGMYEPAFEGSRNREFTALPFASITYDDRFSFDGEGFSARVLDSGPLGLTAKLGYDFGRAENDDPHLTGLGDIDGGAILGFGADYSAGPVGFYADVERTFGDVDGLTGTLGATASRTVGRFVLDADLSATWADGNHMQSYFGVTSAQSTSSGLAAYQADAGVKRVDLELSATYLFSENWALRGEVGLGRLVGDAAKSPIVQDATQVSTGLFVAYRF